MRNFNVMLLLTVVVGVLVLGIAYATIQDVTLTVTGDVVATPDQGNFKVKFSGTPTSTGAGNATVNITNDLAATMNVTGLKAVGDERVIKFTIENESAGGMGAKLTKVLSHTNEEYFAVKASLSNTEIGGGATPSSELTITVRLIKVPITENVTDSITIDITASPIEWSWS